MGPGELAWISAIGWGVLGFGTGFFASRLSRDRAAAEQKSRLGSRISELAENLRIETEERRHATEQEQALRQTVARIPWMAQDLLKAGETRSIPPRALDLVQELFAPQYAVFFAVKRPGFIASQVRGSAPFALHATVGPREGAVAWSAEKQQILTPQDLALETRLVKGEYFSGPSYPFEFCIPVIYREKTTGVILVGAIGKSLPSALDFARTVGVMTSVAIQSAQALADQTRLAVTDGLTGLYNKKRVQDCLQEYLFPGQKDKTLDSLAVFLFDIDHFKQYNDRNGHLAGDELLRSLSQRLREITRENEILGRYGGEEFLLLMPNATKEQAMRGAERVRAAIAAHPFPFADGQPSGCISISGGVAVYPDDGRQGADLIAEADRALYEAKRRGRNRVLPAAGGGRVMTEGGGVEARDSGEEETDTPAEILLSHPVV